MLNSHDDANTLLHHETSEHDMNIAKGPVDSDSAPDNSRPDTPVATTSIPRKDDKMSISFVIDAAIETTDSIRATVQHHKVQSHRRDEYEAAVSSTFPVTPGTHATSHHSGTSRSARPAYDAEQKFFIMYCRLVKDMSWECIEHDFKAAYPSRTVDGLTSIYYRIRYDWSMSQVKKDPTSRGKDKAVVLHRASGYSEKFLSSIGFAHWQDLHGTDVTAPRD